MSVGPPTPSPWWLGCGIEKEGVIEGFGIRIHTHVDGSFSATYREVEDDAGDGVLDKAPSFIEAVVVQLVR